jgi:hypothetical protein
MIYYQNINLLKKEEIFIRVSLFIVNNFMKFINNIYKNFFEHYQIQEQIQIIYYKI